MNHSIEELKGMLSDLDELSQGKAKKYVIASEELSDSYLMDLENLGIHGLVVMAWAPMNPSPDPVELRIAAMSSLSSRSVPPSGTARWDWRLNGRCARSASAGRTGCQETIMNSGRVQPLTLDRPSRPNRIRSGED